MSPRVGESRDSVHARRCQPVTGARLGGIIKSDRYLSDKTE